VSDVLISQNDIKIRYSILPQAMKNISLRVPNRTGDGTHLLFSRSFGDLKFLSRAFTLRNGARRYHFCPASAIVTLRINRSLCENKAKRLGGEAS